MKSLYLLYISPYSFFLWINRATYLGVLASALYFYDKYYGEYNILVPVSPKLAPVCIVGLVAYELGVWLGGIRLLNKRNQVGRPASRLIIPLIIWAIAIPCAIVLFYLQGVPLFTDPMRRAELGPGLGLLKRALIVWLPMASLEIYYIYTNKKKLSVPIIMIQIVTIAMLLLLTAKAGLFFYVVYLAIVYYHLRLCGKVAIVKMLLNTRMIMLGGVLVIVLYVYSSLALSESFFETMTIRVTNLLAQAPNYILEDLPGVPSRSEVLNNDLASLMKTFRIPGNWDVRQLDSELTTTILRREVLAGGLNPTVIGYGWLLGANAGVFVVSLLYGHISGSLVRMLAHTNISTQFVIYIYALVAVHGGLEIFSPIGALLDTGLSVMMYYAMYQIIKKSCPSKHLEICPV